MYKIPSSVMNFATEANIGVYKMFGDFFAHYRSMNGAKGMEYQTTTIDPTTGQSVSISFAEKEEKMNQALKREIIRVAGISNINEFPVETWATHPTLRWASFAVVSALIDVALPQTLIDSIGLYSEIRTIGWGDSAAFDIKPRDLFAVSKAGRGKRTAELHRQFQGQVTVLPENHLISVVVSLARVLAGKESLADFVMKAARSIETAMAYEVYDLFASTMAAVSNTASTGLRVAGFSQSEFTRLAQTVQAWNGGAKVVALGTKRALSSVLPLDANYRYDVESDLVKVGYLRNYMGVDILELNQLADYATPFALKLSDSYIWMLSPSTDKLIKVVLEGNTLAYTDDVYANANLNQSSSIMKSWGIGVATSALGAVITL